MEVCIIRFSVLERAFMVFVMLLLLLLLSQLWPLYTLSFKSLQQSSGNVSSFTAEISKGLFWLYITAKKINPNLMFVNNYFIIPQGFCESVIWVGLVSVTLFWTQWSSAAVWACLKGPRGSLHMAIPSTGMVESELRWDCWPEGFCDMVF